MNTQECDKFLELLEKSSEDGDDTIRLPDVEGVHGIEGQRDDAKYIQLLNTISLTNLVA